MAGKKLMVVSDLHADRWTDAATFEQFEDFLVYVRREAQTLVVNGDVLDLPPIEGEEVSAASKRALFALLQVPLQGVRLVYVVGNHDIAFRGWPIDLRPFLRIVYPFEVVELAGRRIRIEHGHYYDPLFNGGYDILAGIRKFLNYDVGKVAVDTWKAATRYLQRLAPDRGTSAVGRADEPAIFGRWTDAAARLKEAGFDLVLFGHIHHPKGPDESPSYYINTGDWVDHRTVTEIDESGKVAQFDWRERGYRA